jgi:hypothetical protein
MYPPKTYNFSPMDARPSSVLGDGGVPWTMFTPISDHSAAKVSKRCKSLKGPAKKFRIVRYFPFARVDNNLVRISGWRAHENNSSEE